MFAAVALLLGLISGCAGGSGSGGKQTIKIAVQSPLSGGSATLGDAIRNGAKLAVSDLQDKFSEKGFKVELAEYDDMADPKKGVANANDIVSDTAILGVVAHLNSGVGIPSTEVYDKAKLAAVSPGMTATTVTDRKLQSVNRIVARDDFQGPSGAEYAANELGVKKVFIIQDKTAYGQGLAEEFRKKAEELGIEIAGYEGITVGEKDFNGVINQAASEKPDLIYFGGVYAEGALVIKQARQRGLDIPIMGGDGLDSSGTVDIAGDSVKGVYLTSVAGDVTKTDKGQEFAKRYKDEFGKNIESYSAYGYDSASVVLQGILDAIDENDGKLPTREQVMKSVRGTTDFEGIATNVTFDDKGDNEYAKVFIYKFDEASYPASQVAEISQ
jgi:branched-chain amino acid transport system substrate-binding protein